MNSPYRSSRPDVTGRYFIKAAAPLDSIGHTLAQSIGEDPAGRDIMLGETYCLYRSLSIPNAWLIKVTRDTITDYSGLLTPTVIFNNSPGYYDLVKVPYDIVHVDDDPAKREMVEAYAQEAQMRYLGLEGVPSLEDALKDSGSNVFLVSLIGSGDLVHRYSTVKRLLRRENTVYYDRRAFLSTAKDVMVLSSGRYYDTLENALAQLF